MVDDFKQSARVEYPHALMPEYAPYRYSPLAGIGPNRVRGLKQGYRSPEGDIYQQKRRRVAAQVAIQCENVAAQVWGRSNQELPTRLVEIRAKYSDFLLTQLQGKAQMTDVEPVFQSLLHFKGSRQDRVPQRGETRDLLATCDRVLGTCLMDLYRLLQCHHWRKYPHPFGRYILSAAMSMVELATESTWIRRGKYVPNLVTRDLTQLDGAIVPLDVEVSTYNQICVSNCPWEGVEYKYLSRPNHALNPHTLTVPRSEDTRFVRHQLGQFILDATQKGLMPNLPQAVWFYYSRQPVSSTIHKIRIGESYLHGWSQDLIYDVNHDRFPKEADKIKVAQVLRGIYWNLERNSS